MNLVVKIGSSSITNLFFGINDAILSSICEQVFKAHKDGHRIALVTSGAIAVGLGKLGITGERPSEMSVLQAASAVGQGHLIGAYAQELHKFGILSGQVLLSGSDFMVRKQYLSAKSTIGRMLELGVIPVINENDAIADDEIRMGDNDRIAALVAGLIGADVLVLLTDQDGLFSADPRYFTDATLIEQVEEVTRELSDVAGGKGTSRGSGGMATKIMAARIAAWSGVETLITSATNTIAIQDALSHRIGNGTWVARSKTRLTSRKLWIAFAVPVAASIVVDEGAKEAIVKRGSSLLSVGVIRLEGTFDSDDAIEVRSQDGAVIAKGLSRMSSTDLNSRVELHKAGAIIVESSMLIHRDDLIIL